MNRRKAGFLVHAACVAVGACPVLVASNIGADADGVSPAVRGRWVMTNEHGEVLYKDDYSYEFQFARLMYSENPQFSRGWGGQRWTTDSPSAEEHLVQGIRRLTRVSTAPNATAMTLDDDDIFNHPLIYAVEVGGWDLTEREVKRLREYLDRGGVLVVDDFHGSLEWSGFTASMSRVYPDKPIVEIPDQDEVFHVLYDLNEHPQIPGMGALWRGVTYERDGYQPHWRGVYDEHKRLSVIINFNMDMGDAWEHADDPEYPQPLTGIAYRFAINYLLYAMSH